MNSKVLKRLKNIHTNIKFTVYLPLEPGPEHTAANLSTLHKIEALFRQILEKSELSGSEQQIIIDNVMKLEDELGHQLPGKGIAIFIYTSGEVTMYALPFSPEPEIYNGLLNIHLEPLKQYYRKAKPYWVLSLSQNGCRLFKGDGHLLEAVKDATLQSSMLSALGLDEVNNPEIQGHKISVGRNRMTEGFHGHGGFKDMRKKYLQDYFRLMDKRLHTYVHNKKEPVVLVGTGNMQALYKKITNYKYVMPSKHGINPHNASLSSIMQIVSPILESQLPITA
jgi:hypothetical protein